MIDSTGNPYYFYLVKLQRFVPFPRSRRWSNDFDCIPIYDIGAGNDVETCSLKHWLFEPKGVP